LSRGVFCFSKRGGGNNISLKIEKKEFVTKAFRIDKKLVAKMQVVCEKEGISLNKLVEICIDYAFDNLVKDDESE